MISLSLPYTTPLHVYSERGGVFAQTRKSSNDLPSDRQHSVRRVLFTQGFIYTRFYLPKNHFNTAAGWQVVTKDSLDVAF